MLHAVFYFLAVEQNTFQKKKKSHLSAHAYLYTDMQI